MTVASTTQDQQWLAVPEMAAAGAVRRAAVLLGEEAGLSAVRLADLAIVATEIGTNLARHAIDGMLLARVRRQSDVAGVELVAIDRGPGMPDLVESTRDGHSTAGSLGIGLGAIVRLATEFDLYSRAGLGTVLTATVWERPTPVVSWVGGITRPIGGQEICGDAYAAREIGGRRQILLCDGLGHGPLAAVAARAVVNQFLGSPHVGPAEVLRIISDAVQHTRGAVAGVAEFGAEKVTYAGVGNISATIIHDGRRRAMVSQPGILGQQRHQTRAFDYPVGDDGLVVLHSDGVTDRWDLDRYVGLTDHTPLVVAATLLRDAGKPRDDAAVLVARLS
jgi:anti-sigma regulatory factor (Ser/Thr protein kinase)